MPYQPPYLPFGTFPAAKWLNICLYADDGSVTGVSGAPNGIGFLSRRPILLESITNFDPAAEANDVLWLLHEAVSSLNAYNSYIDTSGAYGKGADSPGGQAGYRFYPAVPVSSGSAAGANSGAGGWTLIASFTPVTWATGQQAVGAQVYQATGTSPITSLSLLSTGSWQASSTTRDNCPFVLDLLSTVPPPGDVIAPALAFTVTGTPAMPSIPLNTQDSSGEACRFWTAWAGASSYPAIAPPLPEPLESWAATQWVGSSLLNGSQGICDVLNFLHCPPMFRVAAALSQSVPDSATTPVTFTAYPSVSSFSPGLAETTAYTAPRDGLYLAHAVTFWAPNPAAQRLTGLSVNGTVLWGPAYSAAPSGICASTKTQILSLSAGDTVKVVVRQNSGGTRTLSTAHDSRLVLAWLGAQTEPGSAATGWTPPDPGFRWQAGTPGSDLPGLFDQHLANDLGFLVHPPYFLGYQSSAQSGLPPDVFRPVTLDTQAGIVNGDPGDPWGGWTSSAEAWQAPVPGWYLAAGEVFTTAPGGAASVCAGVQAGGTALAPDEPSIPVQSPDWYQHMPASTSSAYPPGGTFASLYYLLAGQWIQPQVMLQDGGAYGTTAGTESGGIIASHMEVVYLSQ